MFECPSRCHFSRRHLFRLVPTNKTVPFFNGFKYLIYENNPAISVFLHGSVQTAPHTYQEQNNSIFQAMSPFFYGGTYHSAKTGRRSVFSVRLQHPC
jgi:hypothetical protein